MKDKWCPPPEVAITTNEIQAFKINEDIDDD